MYTLNTTDTAPVKETTNAVKNAKKSKQRVVPSPIFNVESDLRQLCSTLAALAQKYVPDHPTCAADFAELSYCIRLLKQLGEKPAISSKCAAKLADNEPDILTHSPQYRHMRNKCLAGLATIVDMKENFRAVGSADYRRGVLTGYNRAGEIAASFIEDIQNEDYPPTCSRSAS